jgi:1-aminocyclopropane-1-carboxylate deaminase
MFKQSLRIQQLNHLVAHIAGTKTNSSRPPSIYMCREDYNSPIAFGGNKIRKLEYVIPDVLAAKATVLVSTGGVQSNCMRAVAAVAAALSLKCVLLPTEAVSEESIGSEYVDAYNSQGNIQLTQLLGAEILPVGRDHTEVLEELRRQGEIPYWIPTGASTHDKGGLGYVGWAFEVEQFEKQNGVRFDTIMVACASGSTLAGMVAGFELLQKKSGTATKRKLIGIDAYAKPGSETVETVLGIAKHTATLIGLSENDISTDDFEVDKRFNAGAYGHCDDTTLEAVIIMARAEGVIMDPVYTGKMAAGLVGKIRGGEFGSGETVLVVHTGGQSALPAYPAIR